MRRRVYERSVDLRNRGQWTDSSMKEIKQEENLLMRRQWALYINRPNTASTRTREAIAPHLEGWLDRSFGEVGFHLTQILTGHGCFGSYLSRIQKVETSCCEHCDTGREDTAEHTVAVCPAWSAEREALSRVVGDSLDMKNVVKAMVNSEAAWKEMAKFADTVMFRKEERERERQAAERAAEQAVCSGDSYSTTSSWVDSSSDDGGTDGAT